MKLVKYINKWLVITKRRLLHPKIIKNHGVKLYDGNHISKNIKNFIYTESYEGEEIKILSGMLKETDRVLEIGAGLGFLTIFCAKRIGSSNVIAYEANPKLIEIILQNFELNEVNPKIYNYIVGNNNSEVDFFFGR